MSLDRARRHLAKWNLESRIRVLDASSATVPLAAAALDCEPARIAKTLAFWIAGRCLLVVVSGDARVDNDRFRARFERRPKMLSAHRAEEIIGHAVGGVCPFGINPGIGVYLDASLKRFERVFPGCGSGNSLVELTLPELIETSASLGWVDVCGGWTAQR